MLTSGLARTAFALAALAVCAAACAENEVDLGDVRDPGAPVFAGPPDAGPTSAIDAAPPSRPLCIATECPAPFATCRSPSGTSYKCGVDLSQDDANCGACGVGCPAFDALNMVSRCVAGACALECVNRGVDTQWRNCNGLVDDGCESDVFTDAKNCGTCGNACPGGEACIDGKCGCPPGRTACSGRCVDLTSDDTNCGGCDVVCDAPDEGCAAGEPPNTYYGCREGSCLRLKCVGVAADCDGDLKAKGCASNGCEVGNLLKDPKNCGGCGVVCKAGEDCVDEGNGPECAVPCSRYGRSKCGTGCIDLQNDVAQCGSCGNVCDVPGPNATRTCSKGICVYGCAEGFADCNGDPSDGCETDVRAHPANCGACGVQCDLAAGQPCVAGQCLVIECKPGQTR